MVKGKNIRDLDSHGNPIDDESLDDYDDVEDLEDEQEYSEDYDEHTKSLTEREQLERFYREEEQSKYEDEYELTDVESMAYYYTSLIKKVSIVLGAIIIALIITIVLMTVNSNKKEDADALYEARLTSISKKLITELYGVEDVNEVVTKNPVLMEYFTPEASHLIDFTDEDNYLRRFAEFNNEPLDVTVHKTMVNGSYVYISYTINSAVNANSDRYAIIEFNNSNKIVNFNEYWQYSVY